MKNLRENNRVSIIYQVIGQNIVRLRGAMTQEELAKKAKVSRATIGTIENGGPISLSKLIRIAEALGINPGDLFISDDDRQEVGIKTKLLLQKVYESLNPIK